MAVLAAIGLLGEERPFVHESLIGTMFTGRIERETTVGELPAIVPYLEGEAFVTGHHSFVIDPADPLRQGFRI
jgi:proline racemase